ncbi:MAG: hypothetical protein IPM21_01480 [Acidobacteria bacterium]|nr:hypothetical protein [Acidobacteriota bacterium]
MAFLYIDSFVPGASELPGIVDDKNFLLKRMKLVLLKISGTPVITSYGYLYPKPPKGLSRSRDRLKANYKKIWEDVIIAFDWDTYGATANVRTYEINIGEFFLKKEIPDNDLEKVVLHEILHIFVDMPRILHHPQINTIIKDGLGYEGEPNPFGTD